MSYVGKYTELGRIGEPLGHAPKILDFNKLKGELLKWGSEYVTAMNTFLDDSKTSDLEYHEYPLFYYLLGFKYYLSYDTENLERIGYDYNKKNFIEFWSMISKFTEPFYFYTTTNEEWLLRHFVEGDVTIFKVTCDNGKVDCEKIIVGIKKQKKNY